MRYDQRFNLIQAFPLTQGKLNLTNGTHTVSELVHCVEDGSATLLWPDGGIDTIDCKAGEDFAYSGTLQIESGKFHLC